MARLPFFLFTPRKYPYRNHDDSPRRPLKIEEGLVVNRVRVVRVHREPSTFYDQTHNYHLLPDGTRRPRVNKFEHLTGEVDCQCLACGQEFQTSIKRIHPNNPKRSAWSCGCERRPMTAVTRHGRQPADLTEKLFGSLEPFQWIPFRGWRCLCHACGNTDGCVVPESRLLLRGRITACRDCQPEQWVRYPPADAARPVVQPVVLPVDVVPDVVEVPAPESRPEPVERERANKEIAPLDHAALLAKFRVWDQRAKVRGQRLTDED